MGEWSWGLHISGSTGVDAQGKFLDVGRPPYHRARESLVSLLTTSEPLSMGVPKKASLYYTQAEPRVGGLYLIYLFF